MKVIFYSTGLNSRLEYAALILLKHILNLEVRFTSNKEQFIKSAEIRINYSEEKIPGCLQINPSSLLFDSSIKNTDPLFYSWGNLPVLFYNQGNSQLPFDPLAATFWMVTRYEEYLPFEPDVHGRFRASESIAFREGFLNKPIVHLWAEALMQALKNYLPFPVVKQSGFNSISTIDVDNAWAYRNKGFMRSSAALLRDFFTGRITELSERLNILRGIENDPFDSYDYFDAFHKSLGIVPQFFFLAGKYGKYDKNINPRNENFKSLIRKISSGSNVGLHPSYNSYGSKEIMRKEKEGLEEIINTSVVRSRQHFLRIGFPGTYRNLIELGIQEDFSMGYHDKPGFRAGMCITYPWFDLAANKQENLTIVPFQIMDRTFTKYLHLSADQAFEIICSIIDETARVNGNFVSIWHNEPADSKKPEDWFGLYKKVQIYIQLRLSNQATNS